MKTVTGPFLLIDDERRGGGCASSNWDTDFRGAGRALTPDDIRGRRRILRTVKEYPTTVKRDINPQTDEVLSLEITLTLVSGNGFYVGLFDGETPVVCVTFRGGAAYAGERKLFPAGEGYHTFLLTADTKKGCAEITLDGSVHADVLLTGDTRTVSSFRCGFAGEDLGEAWIGCNVKLWKNYLVYDSCLPPQGSALPDAYRFTSSGSMTAAYTPYNPSRAECVYELRTDGKGEGSLVRPFAPAEGKIVWECKYIQPDGAGIASFALISGETALLTLTDAGDALCHDGSVLRSHHGNVWQTLRMTVDTENGNAVIRLNGKTVTTLPLDGGMPAADGFRIGFAAEDKAVLQLADLFAFAEPEEPADYAPAPVIPAKKDPDRYVGMNICSLWRGGHHYGWDCITPFAENKPLMGFYDEGIPETADWELKFMAEHGIDFQLYCWYAGECDRPMIRTPFSSAIHDGHMLAKYSDTVKMALLWEASSGAHPASREAFREHYVPYWLDYFFSDDRYMKIDNKAVMSVYAPQQLIRDFGSEEALHEELDYLRAQVKALGYDDLIILCTADNDPKWKRCGFDGINAYNYGGPGADPAYNRKCILDNTKAGYVHTVPTVSVGYNVVAWHSIRNPNMEPKDFADTLQWCVDEMLPRYEKDSWQHKLVMLSTWNEFGEGTYICPAALNGFGYLDAVRSVFCVDTPHTDIAPTKEQQARIDRTHPVDRATLAPLRKLPKDTAEYGVWKKYTFRDQADMDKWEFHGFASLEIRDGILYGHSDTFNPYMILKDASLFPLPAHKIGGIRAHIRTYKPVNAMCCIQGFFSTKPDGSFGPEAMTCLTDPDRIAPLMLDTRAPKLPWKGQITAFRFDPVYAVGDFELVDIEFLLAPPDKGVMINGEECLLTLPTCAPDGEDYLPFDTKSALMNSFPLYWEWHAPEKCFELRGAKCARFTLDEKTAEIDGEPVTLSRPFALLDGVPLLPAALFAEIAGAEFEVTQDYLCFNKKRP